MLRMVTSAEGSSRLSLAAVFVPAATPPITKTFTGISILSGGRPAFGSIVFILSLVLPLVK